MAQAATKKATRQAKTPASRTGPAAGSGATAGLRDTAARTAELSEDVLRSVEAGQRAAIEAVRRFVDTVDEAIPAIGDRPSRRETVIDAALKMADTLVTTQYDFLRSAVRSAGSSLAKAGDPKD